MADPTEEAWDALCWLLTTDDWIRAAALSKSKESQEERLEKDLQCDLAEMICRGNAHR